MLFLLLLLPLCGLEFLVLPAILWSVEPRSWHPALVAICAVIIAVAAGGMIYRMRQGSLERSNSLAMQATWRWMPHMVAEQYRMRLVTYLQLYGWRISSSAVNAHGHVEVTARKDRCFLALTCVNPAQPVATDADLARLAAFKTEAGATHAVMVTAAARAHAVSAGIMELQFDDLQTMDEAIGLQVGYFSAA